MSVRRVAALVVGALLAVSACGSDAGASAAPAASASPRASACRQTGDAGVVKVSIADFEFKPASIAATVGQVVAFTNAGFEPHNATVVAGCATRTLQTGEGDGLVFSIPGSYRFACTVHAWMTGTFMIAP